MGKEEFRIKVQKSNRIVNEPLEMVEGLIFEKVYRQADRTLAKIIDDNDKYGEEEQCLNVLTFLGGRGRGKTSAMCSFFWYLNELQSENEWSELSKRKNLKFLTIPYIDAAMLAEAEYIIDVILAQMWDEFAKRVNSSNKRHDVRFERLERDIKQEFIDVRKAYLILKEREEGKEISKDIHIPVPTALHELAASINLRQELQQLINNYLDIFRYDSPKDKTDFYLVIAIDDIDMSSRKAHFILEQIRRFLCMPRVIVLITADIDRLQLACESRYAQIYVDNNNRRKFINEYLEKVLPYSMRIYMPEIRERHSSIPIETPAKEELGLRCDDEKNMILECIARKCGIYFDGYRRKRHFLQNQSMRSMVNYFEQMVRMRDDFLAWLKIDLKERIIERIIDTEQKEFMNELLSKDYEDVNGCVITYIVNKLYGYFELDGKDWSVGQALYLCRLFEENDARNTEFVNAIIMLYSIMMKHVENEDKEKDKDNKLRQSVVGSSLWGEQEYGLISAEGSSTAFCLSFDSVGKVEFTIEETSIKGLRESDPAELFHKLVAEGEADIIAWLYALLFVDIDSKDEQDDDEGIEFNAQTEEKEIITSKLSENTEEESRYRMEISLHPKANARKAYLTNAFCDETKMKNQTDKVLLGALMELADWINAHTDKKLDLAQKEEIVQKAKAALMEKMKDILATQGSRNKLENNVEIIYSISKVLSRQSKTYEFEPSEAYAMLVSSYKIIERELRRRDGYFVSDVRLEDGPGFADDFMNSPQARVLLQSDQLSEFVREKFEEKLGELLVEYRARTTVKKGKSKG